MIVERLVREVARRRGVGKEELLGSRDAVEPRERLGRGALRKLLPKRQEEASSVSMAITRLTSGIASVSALSIP